MLTGDVDNGFVNVQPELISKIKRNCSFICYRNLSAVNTRAPTEYSHLLIRMLYNTRCRGNKYEWAVDVLPYTPAGLIKMTSIS